MEKSIFEVFAQYGVMGVMLLMFAWYHFKYSAKRFDDQDKRVEVQNNTLEKLIEAVEKMNHNAQLNQKDSDLRQRMYEDRIDGLEKVVTKTCELINDTRETIMLQNHYVGLLLDDNLGLRAFMQERRDKKDASESKNPDL